MEHSLYTIIFEDKSVFLGGKDYFSTHWLDIPINKKIKRIFYKLPNGDCLCLEGYDKYFHMLEACKDLTGKNKGIVRIQHAYIIGFKYNEARSYRITLNNSKDDKFKLGDITTRIFKIDSLFIKGLNKDNFRPILK